MMTTSKKMFFSLMLPLLALCACGKDGKIVSTLKSSEKTVTKTTQGINANSAEKTPLNAAAFQYECAHMKGYGAAPTDTKEGLLVKDICVVMAASKAYDNTRSSAEVQPISESLTPGSLIISLGSVSNGKPVLITRNNKEFMNLGERKVVPEDGGKLAFFTTGRPSDVALATITFWDCYDNKLARVVCPINVVP